MDNTVSEAIEVMERAKKEIISLRAIKEDLLDTLEEVSDLITGYIDVKDTPDGGRCANDAMKAHRLIEQAIDRAKV